MNIINYKISSIANALGLTARRVQQLVKDNILSAPVNNKYDLTSCIRAYEKYLQHQNLDKNNNLHTQKLRLLKVQADKAELG